MSLYRGGNGQVIVRDEALDYIINCFLDIIPLIRRKIVSDWIGLEEITVAHFRYKTDMPFLRTDYASNIGVVITLDFSASPLGISYWSFP